MKKYTTITAAALLIGSISLASCGDSSDSSIFPENNASGESQPAQGGKAAAPQGKPVDLAEQAGRWSTERGAVGEGSRLIIDLTSEGIVSIDVRTMEGDQEAIMESSTGKAEGKPGVIQGTTQDGEGVHTILKKYKTWTLDPSGTITGVSGTKPVKISKE